MVRPSFEIARLIKIVPNMGFGWKRSEPNDLLSARASLEDGLVSTRPLLDSNTIELRRRQDPGIHQWDDFSQDTRAFGERKLQCVNANQSCFTVIEVYQTERNSRRRPTYKNRNTLYFHATLVFASLNEVAPSREVEACWSIVAKSPLLVT